MLLGEIAMASDVLALPRVPRSTLKKAASSCISGFIASLSKPPPPSVMLPCDRKGSFPAGSLGGMVLAGPGIPAVSPAIPV